MRSYLLLALVSVSNAWSLTGTKGSGPVLDSRLAKCKSLDFQYSTSTRATNHAHTLHQLSTVPSVLYNIDFCPVADYCRRPSFPPLRYVNWGLFLSDSCLFEESQPFLYCIGLVRLASHAAWIFLGPMVSCTYIPCFLVPRSGFRSTAAVDVLYRCKTTPGVSVCTTKREFITLKND